MLAGIAAEELRFRNYREDGAESDIDEARYECYYLSKNPDDYYRRRLLDARRLLQSRSGELQALAVALIERRTINWEKHTKF